MTSRHHSVSREAYLFIRQKASFLRFTLHGRRFTGAPAAFFTILLLVSCVQGQDYRKPDIPVPPAWDQMAGSRLAGVTVSTEKLPEARWWQEFRNEELNGLIKLALQTNHDVRRAASRVMEGRATLMAAGAGLYPQVNVSASYSRIEISPNTLAGLGLASPQRIGPQVFATPGTGFNLYNTAADLRWELDLWGRIRRGVEAASAEADALEQDRRAVGLALIADLGQAYFRLRELDEQIAIAEHNLAVRRDSLTIIQTRAEVGLASELDVKRAEVLVAESAAQIPELKRLRAVELHRIEVLVGSPPGALELPPKPLRSVVVQPEIPVGLPSQLLERRPDILQAERTLIAANARIGEARAYFFPSLSITGQGGLQTVDFNNWFTGGSRTYTIGPSITLPIFLGGTNIARLDAAEARYEQMLESYQQTILTAFREVADLLVSIHNRTEQRNRQREQVKAAEIALDLAQVRYREGLVNYLDVLDAERTRLNAETQLVQTERARLTDMVNLFKALGGGWESAQPPVPQAAPPAG
jgi:NodT family efflux transporter outer membrane factor (OMF) lipoprotein